MTQIQLVQQFTIGQRVRTTVDVFGANEGTFTAFAGTVGTITRTPDRFDDYGVHLDGDPSSESASYDADELVAADDQTT